MRNYGVGVALFALAACGGGTSGNEYAREVVVPPTNNSPIFSEEYQFTFDENGSDPIGTVKATDDDGDTLSYSISGGADACRNFSAKIF